MKRLFAYLFTACTLLAAGLSSVSCIGNIFDDQFNNGHNGGRPGSSESGSIFPGDKSFTLRADAAYYGSQNYKGVDEYVLYLYWGDYNQDGTFKNAGTEIALDILCPQSKEIGLVPGKYSCTSDDFSAYHFLDGIVENGTIYPSYAYYQFSTKNAKYAVIQDGTVEISIQNGIYVVDVTFKAESPSTDRAGTFQMVYKGAIEIADVRTDPGSSDMDKQVEMKTFSKVVAENYGTIWEDQNGKTIPVNDWILYLYGGNAAEDNEYAMVEVLTASDSKGLVPGIYNDVIGTGDASAFKAGAVIAGYTEGNDNIAYGTWYCKNGTAYYAASKGQIAIASKDELYSLAFDFVDEDETYGGSFKGSYTGKIEFVDKRENTKAAAGSRGMLQQRIQRRTSVLRNTEAGRSVSE